MNNLQPFLLSFWTPGIWRPRSAYRHPSRHRPPPCENLYLGNPLASNGRTAATFQLDPRRNRKRSSWIRFLPPYRYFKSGFSCTGQESSGSICPTTPRGNYPQTAAFRSADPPCRKNYHRSAGKNARGHRRRAKSIPGATGWTRPHFCQRISGKYQSTRSKCCDMRGSDADTMWCMRWFQRSIVCLQW